MHRKCLTATVLFMTFILPVGKARAEFGPDIATAFGSLEAGASTYLEQNYTFNAGEYGPQLVVVSLDKGSFDFTGVAVDDVIGTLTLEISFPPPIPGLPGVDGNVEGELTVTAVAADSVNADMVVSYVDPAVLSLLALLGEPDPTGEVAFTGVLTDGADDSGATIELEETDTLPVVSELLPISVPINFTFEAFLVHSSAGGTLTVTTTITSAEDEVAEIEETFKLEGDDPPPPAPELRRGDANGNGLTQGLQDGLFILRYAFSSGDAPPCLAAANADGNGVFNALPDAIYMLRWQFASGAEPPDPGPTTCGPDPMELDCATEPDCT